MIPKQEQGKGMPIYAASFFGGKIRLGNRQMKTSEKNEITG